MKTTNYFFILILFLFSCKLNSCTGTVAQNGIKQNSLQTALQNLVNEPDMKNASFAFYAEEIKTGKSVASINPNTSLAPASTLKLVATSTSLELLGDKYRFETIVEYDGKIQKNGTLNGNVYIRGGGDPTLGSDRFYDTYYTAHFMKKWVDAIKKAGIKKINGAIIGDAQIYSENILPRTRTWEDMANYYGTGACGLTIYDNTYHITFKSKAAGTRTRILKIEPPMPELQFTNYVTADNTSSDNAYIFGAPYSTLRSIYGTIPKYRNEFTIKGALHDPAFIAATDFYDLLTQNNIEVTEKTTTVRRLKLENNYEFKDRTSIDTTFSPQLKDIVYRTNKVSFNLYPEQLLAHIGLVQQTEGSAESGIKAVKNFWASKGMDTDGLYINDGSGLSRDNSISPKHLVFILSYMKQKGRYFDAFYQSLPIAGTDGTLKYMCRGTVAQNNVRAKSGSINKVRAYSGYVTSKNGKEIAFAMLSNNYNCSSSQMRDRLEKLMIIMAQNQF